MDLVLGHNSLAIHDLSSSGSQPLHSPDETIHAIVNGELYDFEKLKADLVRSIGHRFQGNSDSEIVLALYQAHGLGCLKYLRGEFAFCLYDEKKRLFIAVRDRYGIKPLLWTVQDERLLVAAKIKAFLPLGLEPEWDVRSIIEAGWNFDVRTLFKGVKKARPGYYMTCNASVNIEHRQYWDMQFPDKTIPDVRSEADLVQGVRERLIEAVRVRLHADVPVGVYLSGGIDSSVVAGIVTHLVKEQGQSMGNLPPTDRVSCFSVAFEETSGFDESDIATRTADFLGVRQHKQTMNDDEFASRFEDATWHCEHHNPDLNFIGKFALSELPRYQVFLPDVLREPDLTWRDTLPEVERLRILATSEEEIRRYYQSVGAKFSMSESRRKLNGISTLASMAAFVPDVYDEWPSGLRPEDSQDVIADDLSPEIIDKMQKTWHPIYTAQYVWTKNHLPNQFMSCLGDRTEMAHSIQGRTPFLDHRLTEFVDTVPPSLKMRWKGGDVFSSKWILREACKGFVTDEIYNRAKHHPGLTREMDRFIDFLARSSRKRMLDSWGLCLGRSAKECSRGFLAWAMRWLIAWLLLLRSGSFWRGGSGSRLLAFTARDFGAVGALAVAQL